MEFIKIQNIANKALIAADCQYHAWSSNQQEEFRATMDDAAQARVEAVILNELLNKNCTAENAGEIWRNVPIAELNPLNWARLYTAGIGEDFVFLNECLEKGKSLLDFNTLYAYDYDRHQFQERANKEGFSDYQPCDYYAMRFPSWVRLIIDSKLYYSTLYSLASYIVDEIQQHGDDVVERLIPHEYVEGENHGKKEEGGFIWDHQLQANGLEPQLEELRSQWWVYQQEKWLEWSQLFQNFPAAVYFVDTPELDENHRHFIFANAETLKQVRWRYFLADCSQFYVPNKTLEELVQQHSEQAEEWLMKTHQNIMENFDPSVVKLSRNNKVVIAPGAFDGLVDD